MRLQIRLRRYKIAGLENPPLRIKISLNESCIPDAGKSIERLAMSCEFGVVIFNFSSLAAPETIENEALE